MVARWPLWHKNMFILSVGGVTPASALSASAISFTGDLSRPGGIFGAGADTAAESHLDTNQTRPEQIDQAIAIFCAATLLGPICEPVPEFTKNFPPSLIFLRRLPSPAID
jgi:hypothetical protein